MIDEWGQPSFTLHDKTTGEPFAARREDGSYLHAAPDYATTLAWDDVTARKIEWEVAWHGGRRRGDWSRTKGELLGDYARLPDVFRWMGIAGPTSQIPSASWYRLGKGLPEKKEGS